MSWIIAKSDNEELLWSKKGGWTDGDDFDTFTNTQRKKQKLPKNGIWVFVDDKDNEGND